jgi:3',5'-cyclic AMP phosphodiesterase CpdA
MSDRIVPQPKGDGIDRRGFLKCMAWAGTGVVWTVSSGILGCRKVDESPSPTEKMEKNGEKTEQTETTEKKGFTFVQISDSHIGFSKGPYKDVTGTLEQTVAKINSLPRRPELLIHTGDLTHLARPREFDTVAEVLKGVKAGQTFYVPGEHDVFTDDGKTYLDRFGKGTRGGGWHSFDHQGVHFIGLVNVANLKPGGLGVLGAEQLDWLKRDVEGRGDSTPLVVFAHVPLWTVYPKWGWGTADSARALSCLKRFGSVTVLNGHIHQILQKVEGNVTFHTARSTAFPQPEPGKAPSPGPVKNLPADKLRSVLGLTQVSYVEGESSLAVVDKSLG